MRVLYILVTAYCLQGRTASGTAVRAGTVAVDPALVRLGTRLRIPGYGRGTALDTGGAIKGYRMDVWFASCWRARQWGVRRVRVVVYG